MTPLTFIIPLYFHREFQYKRIFVSDTIDLNKSAVFQRELLAVEHDSGIFAPFRNTKNKRYCPVIGNSKFKFYFFLKRIHGILGNSISHPIENTRKFRWSIADRHRYVIPGKHPHT